MVKRPIDSQDNSVNNHPGGGLSTGPQRSDPDLVAHNNLLSKCFDETLYEYFEIGERWARIYEGTFQAKTVIRRTGTESRREQAPDSFPDVTDKFAMVKKPCGRRHKKQKFVRPRIVGGSYALSGSHPWLAGINIGSNFCAGSLIRSCWLVTSAHCFANR
ncbi:hypothetical protein Chor_015477 [Crotalus horridus]